jgi:hypothetical protein
MCYNPINVASVKCLDLERKCHLRKHGDFSNDDFALASSALAALLSRTRYKLFMRYKEHHSFLIISLQPPPPSFDPHPPSQFPFLMRRPSIRLFIRNAMLQYVSSKSRCLAFFCQLIIPFQTGPLLSLGPLACLPSLRTPTTVYWCHGEEGHQATPGHERSLKRLSTSMARTRRSSSSTRARRR